MLLKSANKSLDGMKASKVDLGIDKVNKISDNTAAMKNIHNLVQDIFPKEVIDQLNALEIH